MIKELGPFFEKEYGIIGIKNIKRPEKGVSFKVLIIETEDKNYIIDNFKTTSANLSRIDFIIELINKGFSTPGIIKNTEGKFFIQSEDNCVLLTEFIHGDHPRLSEEDVKKNAKLLAEFHDVSEGKEIKDVPVSDHLSWIKQTVEEYFDEIQKLYGKEFKDHYDLMIEHVEEPKKEGLVRGVLHGDFKSDNIMVNQDGKHYLIDLFNMKTGDLIADVAKYIKSDGRRIDDFETHKRTIEIFLNEYFKLRPNMQNDKEMLEKWAKHWASVTFFFFICKFDKAELFNMDIFEKAKDAVKNIYAIDKYFKTLS